MPDNIGGGEIPVRGGDYTAEPVYHVKALDPDSKDRNPHEQFEEQLKRKKEEKEGAGSSELPPEKTDAPAGIESIKDDVILSPRAKHMLRPAAAAGAPAVVTPGAPSLPVPPSPPAAEEKPPTPPPHIHLIA